MEQWVHMSFQQNSQKKQKNQLKRQIPEQNDEPEDKKVHGQIWQQMTLE